MASVHVAANLFQQGMEWAEYVEHAERSRATQLRRFEEAAGEIPERIDSTPSGLRAVILTLPDCADGAWAVPRMVRFFQEHLGIPTRIFHREEHPELMDAMLTDGKRSVPKLSLIDKDGKVVAGWGPRPRPIQSYVEASVRKLEPTVWKAKLFEYYRSDESRSDFYHEMVELLEKVR